MRSKWIVVAAAVVAALLLLATGVEQAAAQRTGRDGAGPSVGKGEARGPSAGPRVEGQRPSTRFSGDGSRTYSYAPRFDRRDDGRRHHRRFRGDGFVYGDPLYGAYAYGPCAYYYNRAMATGSEYWWNRYYACTAGDYD